MKIKKLRHIFLENRRLLWWVYGLAAVVFSLQKFGQGRGADGYTKFENFLIFKNSFAHLIAGENLYASYPAETWDLFKYSPAFALSMAPFALLPDWLGLIFWNLANALVLLSAILTLDIRSSATNQVRPISNGLAWLVLPELAISLQNSQSNGLLAGMIIWAFIFLEKGRFGRAGAVAVAAGFIKIFGLAALAFGFFFQKNWFPAGKNWRFWGWAAASFLILAAAPLLVLSFENIVQVYRWWLEMLENDHTTSLGISVYGWLAAWFGWLPPKKWVLAAGFAALLVSFFSGWRRRDDPKIRLQILAATLIWVVIFNHKAESPTFILAICGAAIWFLAGEKSGWEKFLFWSAFALASLSPTDLFPKIIRESLVEPFVLKVVPFVIIWFSITFQLLTKPKTNNQQLSTN